MTEKQLSTVPEEGVGELKPLNRMEAGFNWFNHLLPAFAAILLIIMCILVTVDTLGRQLFNSSIRGCVDIELMLVAGVGYLCMSSTIIERQSLQIDLLYNMLSSPKKRALTLLASLIGLGACAVVGYAACLIAPEWPRNTGVLILSEKPMILFTGIMMFLTSAAFLFQAFQVLKRMADEHEFFNILLVFLFVALLVALPFLYKYYKVKLSAVAVGGLAFLLLFGLMLLRVPLAMAMTAIGLIGMLIMVRRMPSAIQNLGSIPYVHTANFMMIAFPMFMLMGDMVALAGLSHDLFDAAKKWFGRIPGGLACSSVLGCAGFGAVCGESMVTVIAMTQVAMPSMEENNYYPGLAAGALAAGGTLGILIPPSMGFIVYSMITEESVGKLFMSGILPGILLSTIFCAIIIFQVKRHPEWAPKPDRYPLVERLRALAKLIPVAVLFITVVLGILEGWFTPAEGGAIGAAMATVIAVVRGKMSLKLFKHTMYRASLMFGKMFALFVGVYVFSGFLAVSRLPLKLSELVVGIGMSPWVVMAAIILLYIFLGCVMNIIPMMMLTLPTLYPTVMALGFDSVWFGCLCVIVMEMGMITPPVGLNVFTLAGLKPEIPMATIFKGVMPFFCGMLLCVLLICLFPQIPLFLVPAGGM
ncbi:MAG: TRAP transporter large permease subunit [Mailhella sp.]|nr:TRAP transporter large permease subunit [Mailhella sp.]